jgi:serine/threonine-protein kinase
VTDPLRARLQTALGDRYSVEDIVGSGGMAMVYLATDLRHNRSVAIKVLRPELAPALEGERFHQEIGVAANLVHPNILQLYDSGEVQGVPYYVMPYVEGETLADRIDREDQLPLDVATKIAQQIARALHHAHEHGIVHRDIKPGNVLLVGNQAIVADFGIALVEGTLGANRLTTVGLSVGTAHYMSPEQAAQGDRLDGRADIYSLGCVLFEMIAGVPPFTGKTTQAVMARHAVDDPPPLRTVRRTVTPGLEAIVRKAMAKVPADRFSTAEEMAAALERELTMPGGALGAPGPARVAKRRWRRAILGVVVVAGAVVAGTMLRRAESPGSGTSGIDADLIAVAPFRITATGSGSFADLENGIPELMYLRLAGDDGPRAVYPGTASPVWSRLSDGGPLTDSLAFQGARALGAGRLVLGHILVTGDEAILTASLFDVVGGRVVATAQGVRGPVNDLLPLVDELSVELLIRGSDEGESRLGYFVGSDLNAVRAYLAGQAAFHQSHYAEAKRHFSRALDIDSTFAIAGLQLVVANSYELDPATQDRGLRAAWAGRTSLTSRDRILLDAFRGGSPSVLDRIVAWDSAVALMPDRKTVQFLRADYLFHYGVAVGAAAPWATAEAGFREVTRLDPNHGPAQAHLFELAALRGDTAEALDVGRTYLADETRDYGPYYRWLMDLLEGEGSPEELAAGITDIDDGSLSRIAMSAQLDGYDIRYAIAATEEEVRRRTDLRSAYHGVRRLALNRGRPSEAREARARTRSLGPERYDPLIDVFDALYWGGDSATAAMSVGERDYVDLAPPPDLVTLGASPHFVDVCAVGLWRMRTGAEDRVPGLVRTLFEYARRLDGTAESGARLCAQILETDLAVTEGRDDADLMLARLDSMARRQFFAARELRVAANLTLARLYEGRGDPASALAVLERRRYGASGALQALSTFLYEESRLAVLVGDRERASRAARLYLNLRDDPEPIHAAQVDSVRARLEVASGS